MNWKLKWNGPIRISRRSGKRPPTNHSFVCVIKYSTRDYGIHLFFLNKVDEVTNSGEREMDHTGNVYF